MTNTIIFYNSINKKTYRPPAYKLDESQNPSSAWPKQVIYSCAMTCALLRNRLTPMPEPSPPGSRVKRLINNKPINGTIHSIPINDDSDPQLYSVLLNSGMMQQPTYEDLLAPLKASKQPVTVTPDQELPAIFSDGAPVTYNVRGAW